jgi:hypothetical protein
MSLSEVRIYSDRKLVAAHPILEGRYGRSLLEGHRRWSAVDRERRDRHTPPPTVVPVIPGQIIVPRSLAIYDQVGAMLAAGGAR